jgi:hypothetical protein
LVPGDLAIGRAGDGRVISLVGSTCVVRGGKWAGLGAYSASSLRGGAMMASKPHRLFEVLWRLLKQSGQSPDESKDMLFMLIYLAALLGLFWAHEQSGACASAQISPEAALSLLELAHENALGPPG